MATPTRASVFLAVERYVARFAAPRAHVRHLIRRKLVEKFEDHSELDAWLDEALDAAEGSGLVNDDRYVRDRVRALVRRGNAAPAIVQKLRLKGIPTETTRAVLQEMAGDPRLLAAATLVRRRKLGPYAAPKVGMDRAEASAASNRELGKLARAGFDLGVARRVLAMSADEVEELCLLAREL